ncbi:M24 family metallopeptidase [Pyramidobacter piscolens]|uniref:M24 family metallopeptidase n=1 Tax=Pyramidobacter piscolens TaxID=638849 RepID=UPI001FCAEC82|nr:Xaa-Pro peptidase family protein [Pyramidobacter piscolens]BDF77754.1 proline dipeptidase [Pyramidobacter piscolens]
MNQRRIDKIMDSLKEAGLTQALLSDPFSLTYVTGDNFRPGERFLALLLREGQKPALFLNRLFFAPHVAPENIVPYDDTERGALKALPLIDRSRPLGVDKKMPAEFLLELQQRNAASGYVNASPCVDHVRACKDAEEIALMVRASQMNDQAMLALRKRVREGVTEIGLADELAGIYRELGADGLSFPSIVSFGANAADPHHSPDGTELEPGQCVLFDIGCIKDGYCSDMTRTYYYKSVNDKDREIYEITRRANEAAEAAMKPGVRYCDLDGIARKVIAEAGYGPYFTHRLGHSIGQQGHEWGDVSSANTEQVRPGNIFSCEPGIYLPGETGVRIEDLCLITETGVQILNQVSKELQIIE